LLRARGARGRRESLLSDSRKKRAEDDREKGHKGEQHDRGKGDAGESEHANERGTSCRENRKRQVPSHKHIFLTLLNFLVLQLFSIRLLPLAFRNSSKAANLLK
jgi:hypothetical protein